MEDELKRSFFFPKIFKNTKKNQKKYFFDKNGTDVIPVQVAPRFLDPIKILVIYLQLVN